MKSSLEKYIKNKLPRSITLRKNNNLYVKNSKVINAKELNITSSNQVFSDWSWTKDRVWKVIVRSIDREKTNGITTQW